MLVLLIAAPPRFSGLLTGFSALRVVTARPAKASGFLSPIISVFAGVVKPGRFPGNKTSTENGLTAGQKFFMMSGKEQQREAKKKHRKEKRGIQ
jgi:hypothetical protein